jgi:hypothetical protein
MVTVGYGDITPVSSAEKIYSIFMILGGCCIFAYAVNTIGSIFAQRLQEEADFKLKKYHLS